MTGSAIPEAQTAPESERAAGLALLRMTGFDIRCAQALKARHGNFRQVLETGAWDVELPPSLQKVLLEPDWDAVAEDLAWLAEPDRTLVWWHELAYPTCLAEIPDPPPALFVEGRLETLHDPMIAVVGSRNPSRGGRQTAQQLAEALAAAGVTVVSGLAMGIDAAAHSGALQQGETVAVTGNGLDRVYPARHRDLARQIVAQGALVSEFPPGTPPRRHHFPRRNRIIAGLSLGTLVVEAAEQSGSLITARQAGEFGRDVFAVPGSIHNPVARGCHRLLREGAKLVETVRDILEELNLPDVTAGEPVQSAMEDTDDLDDESRKVLEAVDFAPTPFDRVVERAGLTVQKVSSMLVSLEIQGRVAREPGARFTRAGVRRS